MLKTFGFLFLILFFFPLTRCRNSPSTPFTSREHPSLWIIVSATAPLALSPALKTGKKSRSHPGAQGGRSWQRTEQNHGITEAGKALQAHRVQLFPRHCQGTLSHIPMVKCLLGLLQPLQLHSGVSQQGQHPGHRIRQQRVLG